MRGTLVLDPAQAPWLTASETCALVAALRAGGRDVRFVGGCVRDALAGRPVSDVDLATPETPARVMELLQAAGIKVVPTGIEHGTVTAVTGGRGYEITTLRRDVSTDGRRAVVAFTDDWTEDAARRDFTFNALSAEPDGTVHDPFGGVEDLRAGRVRFVGDAETRIREDVLRILRFFRIHAHYGKGEPDAEGFAACARLAGLLPRLSGERVGAETLRLLAAPDPASTVARMRDAGVLAPILPEIGNVERLRGLQAQDAERARDPLLRLAATLPDDAAAAQRVAEGLRVSNAERERLMRLVQPPAGLWPPADDKAVRRALHRLGRDMVIDLGLLAAAEGRVALARAVAQGAAAWHPVAFPLKGQDALDLGVPAGPEVGRLIGQVEEWWEAGDYQADRAACLARLKFLVESKTA